METHETSAGLALVTGASSGIGRALARRFVEHGFDVVVAAEDAGLDDAATQLRGAGREVVPVRVDLCQAEGVERLWKEAMALGRPVAAAALNVGVGVGGEFAATPLERHLALVDLNVRSTVHLAKRVVDHMVANRSGRILVTSSIAATAPGPYHATYAASKAFGHSFAEGIRHELRNTGVTVTSLMPGPTDTHFFQRANMTQTPLGRGQKDDPDQVAKDGFDAMMAGRPHVVAGSFKNRILAELSTHLPDRLATPVQGRMAKPRERAPH